MCIFLHISKCYFVLYISITNKKFLYLGVCKKNGCIYPFNNRYIHPNKLYLILFDTTAQISFHDTRIMSYFISWTRQYHFACFQYIRIISDFQCLTDVLFYQENGGAFCTNSLIVSKISFTTNGASPIDGSSSSNNLGRAIRARPMASICCWPPDNVPPS